MYCEIVERLSQPYHSPIRRIYFDVSSLISEGSNVQYVPSSQLQRCIESKFKHSFKQADVSIFKKNEEKMFAGSIIENKIVNTIQVHQQGLVWDFPLFVPTFLLSYFLLLFYNYPGVFFLLSPSCCSRAQGILCGLHTSCMDARSLYTILNGLPCISVFRDYTLFLGNGCLVVFLFLWLALYVR